MKKILYIDMDNVLVDFISGVEQKDEETRQKYIGKYDEIPGVFELMHPMPDAIESYHLLANKYDTFILSTAPWDNPSAWLHKIEWVRKHLGTVAFKRLILTHRKDLNKGHYLIDDREANGAKDFGGELLLFGPENPYKDWEAIRDYLL